MKAIKSVLANRKLFQGGGLVPPGNPSPANGILASSESLIDAVVRDAVGPQGGPTMSMNQGGVARFQGGGFSAERPGIGAGQVSVDPMTGITGFGPGATPELSYRRRAGDIALPPTTSSIMEGGYGTRPDRSTSQSRYESQFPYSAQLDESFWSLAPPLEDLPAIDTEEAKSPIEYAALSIPSLIKNLARGIGQVTKAGVPHFAAAANWLVQNQDSDHLSVAKLKELYTMMMRQPEYTGQIQSISDELMSSDAGKNMDAEEFKLSVSDELYKQQYQRASSMQGIGEETDLPPLPTMPGYLGHAEGADTEAGRAARRETRPWEDTLIDPADPSVATGFTSLDQSVRGPMPTIAETLQAETDPETQLRTTMQILGKDMPVVSEDLEAYYNVIASGDGAAQQAFIEDLKARKGQAYVAMLLSQVDEFGDKAPADAVIEEGEPPTVVELPAITVTATEEEEAAEAAEAIVADASTAGKAGAGAVEIPPGQYVEVQNSTNPKAPPVAVDRQALITELAQKGKNVDPDAQWAAFADVIKQIGQKAEGSGNVNIDTLKAEMEALLPTVEDDPQMKGMHLILLGASIAGGTSSNPWTNIAQGVAQQMPNLIKYRASQTEAKRARETTIAKLAIEQKLGIQSEQRAEARQIAAEQRGFAIDMQKELFEKSIAEESYTVAIPTTIDASVINPEATGPVTIPFGTPFSLTQDQLDFFSDNNIPLIKTDKLTLDDMRLASITGATDPRTISPKVWKQLSTMTDVTIFRDYLNKGAGIKYKARFPEAGAIHAYPDYDFSKSTVDNSELLHVQGAYERATKDHKELFTELDALREIALSEGMTGPARLKQQFAKAVRGWSTAEEGTMLRHIADNILGGEDKIATYDAFYAKARLILAKIAPILLGESGKTISDTDRERVARALGINIERRSNQDGTITWVLGDNPFQNLVLDPAAISNAITETQRALSRNLEGINMEMATFYDRHNRDVPGGEWGDKNLVEDVYQQDYDWDIRRQET